MPGLGEILALRYAPRVRRSTALILSTAIIGGAVAAPVAQSTAERLASLPLDAELDGYVLPADRDLEWFFARSASRIAERAIYLDAQPELLSTSLGELGIQLDVPRTIESAREAPAANTWGERIRRLVGGPPLQPFHISPAYTIDVEQLRRTLRAIAATVDRAAVDARLDPVHHERVEDIAGRKLDFEATRTTIEQGDYEEYSVFRLAYQWIPAAVTSRQLPPIDVSGVLAAYTTDFARRAGPRAVNIRRGAELLNGFIIQPGAVFSFNHTVGPRVIERGFVDAPVIVHDEIDKGPGGGICQVASTLFAAVVHAGLEVIERRSHSRPSGYAPLGLDATVIDGKVDLRFRNPYEEPLMIHARLPTRTTLRVEILGRRADNRIEHSAQVIKRYPFLRRVVDKAELAPGEFKRTQKGSYGYDIVSIVRRKQEDGSLSVSQYSSKYYPVPEVFWLGPGTPLTALPPLPEGATGLEPEEPSAE